MKTAIIIISYNSTQDIIHCIESVEKFNTAEIKYIIVDNASTKKNREELEVYLKSRIPDFQRYHETVKLKINLPACSLIVCENNKGYAQGSNVGLSFAYQDSNIDHVMILNPDTLFVQDIIPSLCGYADRIPDAGIISPLLLKKDGKSIDYNCARYAVTTSGLFLKYLFYFFDPLRLREYSQNKQYVLFADSSILQSEKIRIELPSGSCMLMKKAYWEVIEGFDPNTFLFYEEDILFKRIERIKKQNYLIPSLKCIHLGEASTKKIKNRYFMLKTDIESSAYYINHYSNFSKAEKIIFKFIKPYFLFFSMMYNLYAKIKR
ncbi:MAG: glycosyltransferase [Fibrobacter sp.]|jgi:GT2 family glycosyltransferase|nr:glycosyltransferase [Fibrobacter sp.]